jgi:cell division protein FtsL
MLQTVLTAAPAAEDTFAADVVSLVITAVVSATVFSALITGLVQFLINRRNSRITERKNTVDEHSDLIVRYKEQASEERVQKESAVKTIKELLADSREQVIVLKSTVDTLTKTIELLESLSAAQSDVIKQLTEDRDRTKEALERAEARVLEQRDQLRLKQQEITTLLGQTISKQQAARILAESFDIPDSVVE